MSIILDRVHPLTANNLSFVASAFSYFRWSTPNFGCGTVIEHVSKSGHVFLPAWHAAGECYVEYECVLDNAQIFPDALMLRQLPGRDAIYEGVRTAKSLDEVAQILRHVVRRFEAHKEPPRRKYTVWAYDKLADALEGTFLPMLPVTKQSSCLAIHKIEDTGRTLMTLHAPSGDVKVYGFLGCEYDLYEPAMFGFMPPLEDDVWRRLRSDEKRFAREAVALRAEELFKDCAPDDLGGITYRGDVDADKDEGADA